MTNFTRQTQLGCQPFLTGQYSTGILGYPMNCLHNRHFVRKMFFHSVTHAARKKSLQHTQVQHALIHLWELLRTKHQVRDTQAFFSFRFSVKRWNKIPCSLRNLPKKEFKREISPLLLETPIVIHNQKRMAEKSKVCMGIQSQLILAK